MIGPAARRRSSRANCSILLGPPVLEGKLTFSTLLPALFPALYTGIGALIRCDSLFTIMLGRLEMDVDECIAAYT